MKLRTIRTVMGLGVACALIFAPRAVSAQAVAQHLERGRSGPGASALVATNDDATIMGVFGGYAFGGLVDAGVALLRYGFDEDDFGGADVSAVGLAIGGNVVPIRHGGSMPVSIAAQASLQKLFFSSDDLDRVGIELGGWSFTAAGSAFRDFAISGKLRVVPQAWLFYTHTSVTADSVFGEDTDSDDDFGLALHGNLTYDAGSLRWVGDPFLQIDDDNVTFGLIVGCVFGR